MPRRKTPLQEGDGFLVDVFSKLTGGRPGERDIKKLLQKHGSAHITGITVFRQPISTKVTTLMNLISAGNFEKAKQHYRFDDLFHLGLVIHLDDGYSFRIEKNSYPTISPPQIASPKEEKVVPLHGRRPTLDEFIQNGMKSMGTWFFDYDYRDKNCQHFADHLLSGNGLLTPDLHTFIQQNMEQSIAKEMPEYASQIALFVTDLSGITKRVLGGSVMSRNHAHSIPLEHLMSEHGSGLWDFAVNLGKSALKEGVKSGAHAGSSALGSHLGTAAGNAAGRRIVGSGVATACCTPIEAARNHSHTEKLNVSLSPSQRLKISSTLPTSAVMMLLKPQSGDDVVYLTKRDHARIIKAWKEDKGARVSVLGMRKRKSIPREVKH